MNAMRSRAGPTRAGDQRGSVAILLVAVMVVAGTSAILLGRVGALAVARGRAETAADAAALAAADELALGHGPRAAAEQAARIARANGAQLVRCRCDGNTAVALVRVPISGHSGPTSVSATAKAQIQGVLSGFIRQER